MNWPFKFFRPKSSSTACLTKAVIKLWLEEPDNWTEKCVPSFEIPYGMSDGYELTHKTHMISIYVPLSLGFIHGCHERFCLLVRIWDKIPNQIELKEIENAVINLRPHKALAKHRAQRAAFKVRRDAELAALTKIGCPNS